MFIILLKKKKIYLYRIIKIIYKIVKNFKKF